MTKIILVPHDTIFCLLLPSNTCIVGKRLKSSCYDGSASCPCVRTVRIGNICWRYVTLRQPFAKSCLEIAILTLGRYWIFLPMMIYPVAITVGQFIASVKPLQHYV